MLQRFGLPEISRHCPFSGNYFVAMPVRFRLKSTPPGRAGPSAWWWAAVTAALLAAGDYSYYRMFTGFSFWDDDGYVLIGIRSLLHGHRLYDDVYAQYGPFYYLVQSIIYFAIRQPVTHDMQRFIGVALWLVSAILWARVVFQLTRSRVWTGLAFLLAVKLLGFFPLSAGHPEEICMVLVAAGAVIACGLDPMRPGRSVPALACIAAALTFTKVNIGLYFAIAISLILLKASTSTRPLRFARFLVYAASVTLPVALMRPLFGFRWAQNYCFMATLSIAAVLFFGSEIAPGAFLTVRTWWLAALSFVASALVITLPFFFRGTTPSALLQMTVLQHAGFARNWYYAAPVARGTLLAAVVSLTVFATAWVQRRREADRRQVSKVPGEQSARSGRSTWLNRITFDYFLPTLKAGVGLACLLAAMRIHPYAAAAWIFGHGTPFVWLLLVDPVDGSAGEKRYGLFALCTLTVLVCLYAFPVAGAQMGFTSLPTAMVAILLLRDTTLRIANAFFNGLPYRRALQMSPAIASLLVLLLLGHDLLAAHAEYRNSVSLNMPGAERIRVTAQVADVYRWMKLNLDSCGAIYSVPGLFSLNFWTGKESPTNLNMSNSIGLLNEMQQRAVTRDLSRQPELCIVYSPELIEFWRRGQDLSRSPLNQYVQAEFKPTAERDGYFIMKRK
jgi:hypothetical protein